VNTPRLNPSHAGRYSIYLPRRDGRLSWPSWLDSAPAGSRTSYLSITSPTLNQCNHQDNHPVCCISLTCCKSDEYSACYHDDEQRDRETYVIVSGTSVGVVHRWLGRHRSGAVTVLNDEIDRHFTFETTDVSVTEVVAQFVHLFTPDGPHTIHNKYDVNCIYRFLFLLRIETY